MAECSTDTELDSPPHHFKQYNIMIITIVVLLLDWLVLTLNQQRILSYHSLYIIFLVLRLWARKQPKSYTIVEGSTEKEEKVLNKQKQNQIKSRKCTVCNAVKPERYYHCKRCQKCVYLMDHHCHWVGNCIGQYNSKVYLHLLINILIHSTIVLGITIYNYSTLFDYKHYQMYYLIDLIPAVYSIYQSQRLIHDFWLCVKNNQTLIQSFKKVHGPTGKTLQIWQKYMGKSRINWFLPSFQSSENCNLLQKVIYPKDEQVKQYDDPEDYIYGPLDQQDQQLLKEE